MDRTGKRVKIKAIRMMGKIYLDGQYKANPGVTTVRLYIIRDARPGSQQLAFDAFMDMKDKEPTTAMIKTDYRDRLKILKYIDLEVAGGKDFRVDEQTFELFMDGLNHEIVYNHNDQGTLDNILSGSLHIYQTCSNPDMKVNVNATVRLYMFDSLQN